MPYNYTHKSEYNNLHQTDPYTWLQYGKLILINPQKGALATLYIQIKFVTVFVNLFNLLHQIGVLSLSYSFYEYIQWCWFNGIENSIATPLLIITLYTMYFVIKKPTNADLNFYSSNYDNRMQIGNTICVARCTVSCFY